MDTIFPENNEPEVKEEVSTDAVVAEDAPQPKPAKEEKPKEEKNGLTTEDIVETLENAGFKNVEDVVEPAPAESAIEDIPEVSGADWGNSEGEQKVDENGWPVW